METESTENKTVGDLGDASLVTAFIEDDADSWEQYVNHHPSGTLFHSLRWRDAIRATFRHGDRYLVARRAGEVCGVLPLAHVSSWVFGTSLISVPFGVYGGVLADDHEAETSLLDHATKMAGVLGAKYVELRHLNPPATKLPGADIYFTFIDDVPEDREGCLLRIPRKARAEVRKAIKNPSLEFETENVSIQQLYRLFSLNKRQLGSPIFPSSLFWHVKNLFANEVVMHSVTHDGTVVAAVMSFIHRGTVMPYYSGTLPGTEKMSVSNLMYFGLMEWASENGLKKFDFGRSREGTGAYSFKKHQGFEARPLSYDYILNTAAEIPAINPSNPKYRFAKNIFSRMPLWMAQKVGSWVVKRAPF